jgi:hypothetical protein
VQYADFSADGLLIVSGSEDQTIRLWDVKAGSPLAEYWSGRGSVSWTSNGRDLILPRETDLVDLLEPRNVPQGPAQLTGVRLFLFDQNAWSPQPEARCRSCGVRFTPPPTVLQAIDGITRDAGLTIERAPCVSLPAGAWENEALRSECPDCKGPVRFNPFLVDQQWRWQRARTEGKLAAAGSSDAVFRSELRRPAAVALLWLLPLGIAALGIICFYLWSWGWLIGVPVCLLGVLLLASNTLFAAGVLEMVPCPHCESPAIRWRSGDIYCRKCSFLD